MQRVAHDAIDAAVQAGDLDELLRLVDRLSTTRDWDALEDLRARCARAHETGRQLWPAASHAAYRLALEAPPAHAAAVLVDDSAPFSLGPLPEVAAHAHTWAELAPHLTPSAAAVITAHERVLRGEDLAGVQPPGPPVLDLPLRLAPWEPAYALAEYHADRAAFPMPAIPKLDAITLPASPDAARDEASDALLDLVRAWTTGSNGRATAVTVDGTAHDAIAAVAGGTVRATTIDAELAVALMGWAGASGGAHGRRPGAAAGRFGAWWVAAALGDLLDDWPPEPDHVGSMVTDLTWVAWHPDEPQTGWRLHLAIEDPARGRAWCVSAVDAE